MVSSVFGWVIIMRVSGIIPGILMVVVLSAGKSWADAETPPNVVCFYPDVAYISKGKDKIKVRIL